MTKGKHVADTATTAAAESKTPADAKSAEATKPKKHGGGHKAGRRLRATLRHAKNRVGLLRAAVRDNRYPRFLFSHKSIEGICRQAAGPEVLWNKDALYGMGEFAAALALRTMEKLAATAELTGHRTIKRPHVDYMFKQEAKHLPPRPQLRL